MTPVVPALCCIAFRRVLLVEGSISLVGGSKSLVSIRFDAGRLRSVMP